MLGYNMTDSDVTIQLVPEAWINPSIERLTQSFSVIAMSCQQDIYPQSLNLTYASKRRNVFPWINIRVEDKQLSCVKTLSILPLGAVVSAVGVCIELAIGVFFRPNRCSLEHSGAALVLDTASDVVAAAYAGHAWTEGITVALVAFKDLILGFIVHVAIINVVVKGHWEISESRV